MTIDKTKHNRSDLKAFRKKLSKWFNNYNTNKQTSVKYLLIPELHRDKTNWHMHGLIMGIPADHLEAFTLKDKIPRRMKKMLHEGRKLYNWPEYADAFGFVSLGAIKNPEAVAHYITKYISKNIGAKIELNSHVYYCSKGLKRAEAIHKGRLQRDLEPDFVNEHIAIKTVRSLEEAMRYFSDNNR